ncbi:transaldolase family protein [Enterococcus gilvus]|uniref:Fructose-6-phosphate aldolase n=1 Tax=Enterococcus gilvus ATCC BAA-350 TaxID=1158614 RepID=R2VCR4_9ENTE|nr:transaldolase family protein [Enterococcus gilvus]EOI55426.1 fructose-6-phosphate aldolase [Enterococcus gilvus ATCC BAA-350]EOW82031.1 fructose-6-phosphate aldolase [Enterococcus gilvus ATCC BAA-350]OJG43060.1 fructose-6-phosphate aldolase [Enterococcus gilvus]
MKYFLDSAKIEEIRYARDNFGIDGVTTNPRHIMNSGKPFLVVLEELANEFKNDPEFPISVEINPHLDDADEIVAEGKKIAALSKNFVIKIPCCESGLTAARRLEEEGVRTNVTLVFSPSQSIVPAKNGSKFVSPFVGWKENSGDNAFDYIRDIVKIYKNYDFETEIIVAALRNGFQIGEAAKAGADIVTCGLDVFKASFEHPFTDYGLGVFRNAWDNTKES